MGKSVVLKDLGHCPKGYVRQDDDSVICRVQLNIPVELAVLFCDGTIGTYALDGMNEQRFSCSGAQMHGCYVHRENELLLVSDDAMSREFARQMLRMQKKEEVKPAVHAEELKKEGGTVQQEDRREELPEKERRKMDLPQRRWPQPPCWETACYRDGHWQEWITAAASEAIGD